MNAVIHERPGVYSSYDASAAISGGGARKVVGVAAKAASGTPGEVVRLTGYAAGAEQFGKDAPGTVGMETLLRLLYRNGASAVAAVAVDGGSEDETAAYEAAFAALERCEDVGVVVCGSTDAAVHQALSRSVAAASAARRERVAVLGAASGETVTELTERAKKLNSERVVLVAGEEERSEAGSTAAAAAVAAALASTLDPASPLNGTVLQGLGALANQYSDDEIDLLVRGGVTPLEETAGSVSVVRGITTRTSTGSAADAAWRELSTVLIADDVIPQLRNALRSRFARAKNTAQTRSAIRSQVIVELERKRSAEIIDSFEDVSVTASENDPAVCQVSFSFAVSHGLNQIYLTAHITV